MTFETPPYLDKKRGDYLKKKKGESRGEKGG